MAQILYQTLIVLVLGLIASGSAIAKDEAARSISMTCGDTNVQIICGYNPKLSKEDDRVCNHNTLSFTLKNKSVVKPPVPAIHDQGSTPMGLRCSKGSDGNYYALVSYRSGPYDCDKCFIDEIYKSTGEIVDGVPFWRFLNQKGISIKSSSPLHIEELLIPTSTQPLKERD
jgi:hypothetical protein